MAKKKKSKSKTKDEQDERPDDGTTVYDETEDDEDWVEDEPAASATEQGNPPAEVEPLEPLSPQDYAAATQRMVEETAPRETATTEAPPDPIEQPPVEPDYDVTINEPQEVASEPDQQEKYKEPPAPIPGMEPPRTLGDEATEPQPQQLQPGEKGKRKKED